jgi:hypothetical protein
METLALFAWLISHQPTILLSQNKPANNNQPTLRTNQHRPSASRQTNRLTHQFPGTVRNPPPPCSSSVVTRAPGTIGQNENGGGVVVSPAQPKQTGVPRRRFWLLRHLWRAVHEITNPEGRKRLVKAWGRRLSPYQCVRRVRCRHGDFGRCLCDTLCLLHPSISSFHGSGDWNLYSKTDLIWSDACIASKA